MHVIWSDAPHWSRTSPSGTLSIFQSTVVVRGCGKVCHPCVGIANYLEPFDKHAGERIAFHQSGTISVNSSGVLNFVRDLLSCVMLCFGLSELNNKVDNAVVNFRVLFQLIIL